MPKPISNKSGRDKERGFNRIGENTHRLIAENIVTGKSYTIAFGDADFCNQKFDEFIEKIKRNEVALTHGDRIYIAELVKVGFGPDFEYSVLGRDYD